MKAWLPRIALWIAAAVVVIGLLWPAPVSPRVGHSAPLVTLPSATSKDRITVQAQGGRPLLVEVFASWCGACRRSNGALSSLASASRVGALDVLAVSVDDKREAAREAAETWPMPVAVLHDERGLFSRAYEIRVLPTYIFIDATGRVTEVSSGPPGAAQLRRWLNGGE